MEYIRAWLFATKLTKTLIPLPYSDCLLTESNLRNVSPIFFTNGGELRNSLKVRDLTRLTRKITYSSHRSLQKIEKNNKRLKGANPILKSRRQTFEIVRTFYADKVGIWCACDFEAWDRDHRLFFFVTTLRCLRSHLLRFNRLITEFGWSLVRWEDGKEIQEQGHLVVKERKGYRNTFVPNNREVMNLGAEHSHIY